MDSLLNIEPGLMVWTIVSFAIFVFLLRKFAWGPIMSALDQRERNIRESIDSAERNREESEKLLAQQMEALRQGREEARELIAQATSTAGREGEKVVERARKEGNGLIERARAEIRAEERAAVERLRRDAVDIALEAASKLLERSMESADHRRMVKEFIDRLGAEKKQ